MSVVAFVPVRCGSKSIPLKNIKPFFGKPLVFWVLDALSKSKRVNEVAVATDCNDIEQVVNDFGMSKVKVYRRLPENAEDQSSTESVMMEYLNVRRLSKDDIFILCQATSPFTQSSDFDQALEQFRNEKADSLLTCCRLKRFIWNENGKPLNYDFKSRPRRQEFGGSLVENGAFYINTVGNILSSQNRLSGKIAIYEMPDYTFTELDEPEDWASAESVMRRHLGKSPVRKTIRMVLSDIDGVLTDAGMYYTEQGDELKKFNTYDGMAFKLFKEKGVKVGLITLENRTLNQRRAEKLKLDYLVQGAENKLAAAREICTKEKIPLDQVAYIGDDINDRTLLEHVGVPVCPANAHRSIKQIPNILVLSRSGGEGVVREFYDLIFP